MRERIDHAAEARKILHDVGTDEHGTISLELLDETERWVYDTSMREANVHATLALVEAQQTANMIAYVAKWTDGEVLEVDEQIRLRLGFEGRP